MITEEDFVLDDIPPMKSAADGFLRENFVFRVIRRDEFIVKRVFSDEESTAKYIEPIHKEPALSAREIEIQQEYEMSPTVLRRLRPIHQKRQPRKVQWLDFVELGSESESN